MKYKDYYISYTKDCEENKNGYFCQVYIDKQQEYEVDNFCIHKEELEKYSVNENIIKYIDDNYHLLNELKEKEMLKMNKEYIDKLENEVLEELKKGDIHINLLWKALLWEVFIEYKYRVQDSTDVEFNRNLFTIEDLKDIVDNQIYNLYYVNEGLTEIVVDTIYNKLYDKVERGV